MNEGIIEIDNKFYQECQIVRLPSKVDGILPKNTIVSYGNNLALMEMYESNSMADHYYFKSNFKGGFCIRRDIFSGIPQHLYILSDDEVKEHDYVIGDGKPCKVFVENGTLCYKTNVAIKYVVANKKKKIIATTDNELFGAFYQLPRPSTDFISKYVLLEGKVDKVLVEYLYNHDANEWKGQFGDSVKECFLKVVPDGTITIRPVETKLSFKNKFNKFLDERMRTASSVATEAAYLVVKEFFNNHYEK